MTRALLLALMLAGAPTPLFAQAISGPATVIDGDTLDLTGTRVRLFGVDAVELGQTCERGGEAWRCGEDAKAQLSALVAGQTIACEQRDVDVYGRMVAVCRAGRVDLSQAMAWAGFAVALMDFSEAYAPSVDAAKAQKAGIWNSEFVEPGEWRAVHPRAEVPARAAEPTVDRDAPVRQVAAVAGRAYYRNCDAARAAGVAPLRRGQAGYRTELDRDGDGVACEPYYGR